MSRAFNPEEKEKIHDNIIEESRKLFISQGIKKTNIDQITRAVGIAKGSFYKFFPSKEDLFFDILINERAKWFHGMEADGNFELDYEQFKGFMKNIFDSVEDNPVFRIFFNRNEFIYLGRKLPPKRLEEFYSLDTLVVGLFRKRFEEKGMLFKEPTEVIAEMHRSILALILYKDFLGPNYKKTRDHIIDYFFDGIVVFPE